MTIKSKDECNPDRIIDLTGPDGNAFVLLGMARQYCKQLGLDREAVHAEMTRGDYENLIQVFDKYFGSFITLVR